MFIMIEAYVQYGIYVARVVLTSCLLYGLFTVNETRFVLDFIDVTFVWHLCAKNFFLFCFLFTEKSSILTRVRYHDDFRLHLLFSDVQCDALHEL